MDKLKELLLARKGKWPQIAKAAGIDYSTLCRIMSGATANPSVSTVELLTAAARRVKPSVKAK